MSDPFAGLDLGPVLDRPDLVAPVVHAAVRELAPPDAAAIRVAPIDEGLADTATFCAAYGVALDRSANCVVVAGRRGGDERYAACVVLAIHRADVNGTVRRHLDVRRISFAPHERAVELTGMEYGGITPLGLPPGWPVLVDPAVAGEDDVVVGSGLRGSKLVVPGALLARLAGAVVLPDLAQQP